MSLFLSSCFKSKPDEITVLKIGNTLIKEHEFSLYLMDEAKNYTTVFLKDPSFVQKIKDTSVLNLVIEELLLEWGKSKNILLSPEQIEEKIKEQIRAYPDQQAFERVYSELKIQKKLLKKRTQVLWLKEQLIADLKKTYSPLEKDIKNYYYQNQKSYKQNKSAQLQQIVVQTEREAQNLYKALKSGADFAKLAKEYSLGAESDNGGIVGWVEKGTLPIFDAALNLPIKRISSPKKSPYGYHIFRVLKTKRGRQQPLNEVKEQISEVLKANKASELYKTWLEKQIHRVKVEKNEEALRSIQIDVKSDS